MKFCSRIRTETRIIVKENSHIHVTKLKTLKYYSMWISLLNLHYLTYNRCIWICFDRVFYIIYYRIHTFNCACLFRDLLNTDSLILRTIEIYIQFWYAKFTEWVIGSMLCSVTGGDIKHFVTRMRPLIKECVYWKQIPDKKKKKEKKRKKWKNFFALHFKTAP